MQGNMKMIQALYPKLKIVARGNVIKVLGDEEEMCAFEENILALEKHCTKEMPPMMAEGTVWMAAPIFGTRKTTRPFTAFR